MNANMLKLLAAATMLIDHIGVIWFPQISFFRIVGRLSFPIFAFFVVQGFLHTSNRKNYAVRLATTAVLSEIPFDLALTGRPFSFDNQNICFTLFFGVVGFMISEKLRRCDPVFGVIIFAVLCVIAQLLHLDYGWYGMLTLLLFYLCQNAPTLCLTSFFLLNTGYSLIEPTMQLWASAAVIPLSQYNGQKGTHPLKYFFYLFYPGHLFLLGILRVCFLYF